MSRKPTATKKKLLESAAELFAQRGFQNVTAQHICEKAKANIASINYYFGSKAKLYLEVLQYINKIVEEEYLAEEKFAMADADIAIENFIKARLSLILAEGPANWHPRVVHFEMSNPTNDVGREFLLGWMKGKLQFMSKLTRNFLGELASDFEVNIARNSFHSQCVHLNISRQNKIGFLSDSQQPDKEKIVSEMVKIIMGGLRSYREQIKGGNK